MSRGKKAKKKISRRRQEASMLSSVQAKERNGSVVPILKGPSATIKAGRSSCVQSTRRMTGSSDTSQPDSFTILFKSDELQKLRSVLHKFDLTNTPLLLGAIILGKLDVVEKLIKDGCSVNSCTEDKTTALMWAVRNRHLEMIDLLVKHGADITLLNDNEDNVALIAVQSTSWDQKDFLEFWSSINCKIDLDHANRMGNTVLHYAIERKWNILIELIRKVETNAKYAGVKGVDPFIVTEISMNPEIVDALLHGRENLARDSKESATLCCSVTCTMQQRFRTCPHTLLRKLACTVNKNESNMTIESHLKESVHEDVEATISYLSVLFEDIISCYYKNWQRDRELGYPGYRGGQGDPVASIEEQIQIKKEEIVRLNTILPKLEDSHIKKLRNSWFSLITKVRQTAKKNPREFKDIAASIQIQLSTHAVCPKNDFVRSKNNFIDRSSGSSNESCTIGTVERGMKPKVPSTLRQSTTNMNCLRCKTQLRNKQYNLIQNVDMMLNEAVSSDSQIKAMETINISHHLQTANYECCQRSVFNQSQAYVNPCDIRAVVYTRRQIIKALQTQITLNSTHSSAKLLHEKRTTGILSAVPTPLSVFHVQATRATALTVTDNLAFSENRQAPNARKQPPICGVPTAHGCTSRWDAIIRALRNQNAQCQKNITGNIILSSQDQRKYFTISPGGNFGPIELGLGIGGCPLAIRRLNKNTSTLVVPLLAPIFNLCHNHLLPFTVCTDDGTDMILGTPLCEYNLGEYLMFLKMNKGLEQRATTLVKQFLSGLSFLHTLSEPIIHGNIKPSNLTIDQAGVLKLAEFGVWRSLYRTSRPPSSSMIWFARESYKTYEEDEVLNCNCATDIQVAGMIIHFILTGGLHPYGSQIGDILENISKGSPKIQSRGCEIVDLISWMLVHDPLGRPSINQVLTHVFFWDANKKWSFLLACAGITINGTCLPLPLRAFHKDLETKAISDRVKGDWLSIMRTHFPTLTITEDEYSDSTTGLLVFVRRQLESQPTACCFAMQQFFLRAFPTLPLILYRLLETTQWLSHPVFSPYAQLNEAFSTHATVKPKNFN